MPQQASAPDFSDVDQFVQGQKGGASSFDDIDSFVAGQARGAPAAAATTPAESEFENNVMAAAARTIPRPALPRELQPTPKLPPYDWQRAILGGATDVLTGSEMPAAEIGPGYRPLGEPVAAGVRKLETPGKRGSGALQLGEAGVEALTPLMGPAAIENPANIVKGVAEGAAASEGGGYLLGKTKMSQEDIDNAKALLFFAPGVARSIIDPKLLAEIDPQRTTVGATVAGGRAGAGVRVTPQDVTIGGKIGPFSGSKTFSRGAGAPELEPPTIEGTPGAGSAITPQGPPPIPPASDDPLAQAAGAMNAKNDGEARAARQVQGVPEPAPPAPPAPPQPPPIHEVTPEMAHGLAQTIQKLPPEVRAQALIEMHGKMAEQLLRQGKVVGPDGKLEVIDSPKAADRVAQAFINDEVERQDKLAEEQAKNKPAAAAPKPAPNPNDNIIAQAKALPRESDFSDVDTFVKENTHESSSERASLKGNQPEAAEGNQAGGGSAGEVRPQAIATESGTAARKTGREAFTKGDRVQLEDGRKATVIYTSPEDPFVRVQIDGGRKISKGISKLSKLGVESGNGADHDGSNSGPSTGRAGARGSQEPGVRPGNSSDATDGVGRRIVASDEGVPGSAVSGRELGAYGPPKADFNGNVPEENLGFNSEPAKDYGAAARENTERRMGNTPTDSLINAVYNKLKDGESLGNVTDLNKLAEEHLGSSRTSGQWTPKDVFDAMEAGVNKYLLDRGSSLMALPAPQGLKMLRELMPRITSQGVRTEEQIKNQQFSTPPTESYVAAKAANLKATDVVLEPSAGNGGLAVWPKAIGAEVHVNETSPRRQEMLQAVGFGKPTAHDGEIINSLLDPKIKPTVVLMNPPFSASTLKSFDAKNNNQYGFNHVDSALQRLEDGGRLVAILGGGQANEPNGGASLTGGASGKWFERIAEKYNVRANIRVHGKEYQKYGTAFATRLIVIDKDGATPSRVAVGQVKSWASVKQANVNTLEEAYDALKDVAESRPEVQHEPRANKHENQPRTGVEPSGGAGAASDRVPVRSSGEVATGNELPGGSHRPVGSVGGNEASAGDRGTAVRQPEVQSGNHPETKAAGSPESRSQDVDGERQLSGTETSDAALSLGRDKSLPVKEEEDSSAYVAYHPTLKGPAHPANIVETRTMATVPLPEITYRPSLPESVIADKKLSAVQLEAVSIAGQQNDIVLPDGSRATALIGDGTGVGKGRIGAAVLWDNWRKGRRRLVWVSEKWDLMQDAIRDLQGIGAHELAKSIKPFGKISASTPIDHDGILFTTYALIRSEDKKGNSRVNQLQQWMKGKDEANGAYILYDESHNLKNAVAANAQQVSQIGKAVKKMMLDTPNLRSVSLSATAATDVINLGYLDRLGLWGPGTPFPNGFGEFQAQIASGGMSAMEMVARELKAQGKYLSRTLSYKGVTYEEVEHVLTEEQKDLYRTASKAWASVVQQAEDTIKNTTNGGAQAKARFMSLFYGAQLRFFNVLLTTLKIPTAVEQAKAALADNKSVVITLVNTNEAAQNREKNRDRGGEDSDEVPDYDFGPGEMLKDLVREHYPTQQFVDDVDSEGNPIKVPAYSTDAEGCKMPLINPQAVKERDHLIAQLDRDLKMPANPLDILINSLGGPKKVAELTGRKERYDESSGKFVPRGDPNVKRDEINLSEMRSFQAGKKRIAILSSAAGTGISLHAGNDAINQEKRRHITLQPGWSADKAMQMMGRTHRSNEAHPPEYKTIVSDLGGEKRFSSTLAKRMGSLGALSKGQSNANAGSDLMEKVNFESDQGRQATTAFYNAMLRNIKIPGVDLTGMQILHDLRVLKPAVGGGGMTVPPADRTNVTRLLNRLLALDPDVQNGVYNYFYDVFQATVQQAVEDGTLDTGVKTLPGDEFTVKEERAISKEPKTGAETYYYPVDAQVRTNRMSPAALDKALKANAKRGATIMRNKDGKVQLVMEASPIVHASGSVTPASYVVSPENGNPKKVPTGSLYQWEAVEDWAKTAKDKAETAVDRAASSAEYVMGRYKDDSQPWARRYITDAQAELDRATTELEEADKAATDTPKWAREQWEKQYAEAPAHTTKEHYLIGGAVLRWWNPIREASEGLKIYTAVDSKSGKRVVGVDISPGEIKGLLARITGGSSTVDASQLHTDVLKNGLSYTLEGGIEVKRGRVNRQPVVQFIPPNQNIANTLKGMGLIYERGVQPVYYLPNAEGFQERDRVADMLAKILKEYPVKAEAAKPESLLTGESGELNVSRLAEVVKNFADQDIKPTLDKAGVGIRDVAALGLKALYPRIEQSNPIGRALKAAAPSDAVDALMEVQGDRAKNLAEFDLILKGVEKMFDRLPEEQRIEFVDRIQTGKEQPTPDLLDISEMFKKIMDGQRDAEEEAINLDRPHHITAAQKSPIELARKENYFHNWWETRPGKEAHEDEAERISGMFMPRRPLEGSKGYNKRQSYTLKSGIEAGGEPVTTNPVRILRHRLEDGMKWITARRAWHELGQLDLKTFVAPGDRNPPGFDSIDDKIAKVYFPAELATGKTAIIPGGRYAVEANTARLLNNMLSVDKIRGNALGRGLMWLKMASTALELGWSPFHAVFESIEAMSSMMSLGMQRGYNQGLRQGKPEELLQGLKEIISSPAAPISLAREGAALPAYIEARARLGKIGLTEFGHVISGDQPHGIKEAIEQFREVRKEKAIQRLLKRYPDLDQFIDDMFQGGLVVGQHRDYQVKALGKTMTEAWTADNPLGAVWRAIPTIGQGVMYPLFNIYIPNLKYSLFLRMMSEQVSEHSRELEDGTLTRATLARRVADSVENRFGELNFDTLFLNRSVKTALQFAFRSATYKMGTAREIAGGVGGQSRELAVWAHDAYGLLSGGSGGGKGTGPGSAGAGAAEEPESGKTFGEKALPRLDMRASWIMSLLLTSVILGAVAARLNSKKWPWEWLEDDEDLPGGTLRHLYLETIHPRTGETDSRGKPVRVSLPTYLKEIEHASTEPVKYVLGSLSSILSRGLDLAENRDFFGNYVYNPHATLGTKLKQGAEYMEPVPFVYSSFERGKQQGLTTTAWLSAFGFPKAPSDLDFTPAEKLARSLVKHEPETPEELEAWRAKREALEDGTATREEVKKYLRTQRLTWLQRQVKGMGYGDALDVMEAANDSERAELAHIIDTKRKNALKGGKGAEIEELEEEHSK